MEFLIGMVIGVLFCVIFLKCRKEKYSGTFVIDFSDPKKDVCKLELEEDLDAIYTKKQIVLRIETYDFSQQ